jgi:hypothetical protein
MLASRRFFVAALVCLSNFCLSIFRLSIFCLSIFCLSSYATAQQSDRVIAERVLGPQWKQLSRRAGMIFAGTVLTPATAIAPTQTATTLRAVPGPTPAVEVTFRVDEAIAGVERGQILTIHEWTGAWSMHRPMRQGQHILLFLYPPSRLGLTSPVGGSLGQVDLDSSGRNVSEATHAPSQIDAATVSVVQLERAIRRARNEEE